MGTKGEFVGTKGGGYGLKVLCLDVKLTMGGTGMVSIDCQLYT